MYRRAYSWRRSGPATNNWGRFLCIFLRSVCLKAQVSSDTSSTWDSIRHGDSLVIISKDHHLLHFWLNSSKLFDRGEPVAPHCDFNSGSKSLSHVSWIATIRRKNAWSLTPNLSFSKVAMSRHFCFCAAVKQWGTHSAVICVFQCQPTALLRASGSAQDRQMALIVVYFRITHRLGRPHYVWDEYL